MLFASLKRPQTQDGKFSKDQTPFAEVKNHQESHASSQLNCPHLGFQIAMRSGPLTSIRGSYQCSSYQDLQSQLLDVFINEMGNL